MTGRRRPFLLLGIILLAAVAVRVTLGALQAGGLGRPWEGDEPGYVRLASGLMAGEGFIDPDGRPTSQRTPGFPLLLAALFHLIPPQRVEVVRAVLCGLGALLVPAAFFLGQAIQDRRLAWLLAGAAAFFPAFVVFSSQALTDVPAALLVTLLCGLLLRGDHRPSPLWVAGAGACWGVAMLVRPTCLAFAPALILWQALGSEPWRRRGGRLLLLLFSAALVLSPWALRNTLVHGQFVLLSTKGGFELYKSNNPDATGILAYDHERFKPPAPQPYPPEQFPNEAVRGELYQRDARRFIQDHPTTFLRLCLVRLVQFWKVYSPRATGLENLVLLLSSGVLLPLGLWRLLHTRLRDRADLLLVGVIACQTLVHCIYTSIVRYRVPVEPLVLALALRGALDLGRRWSGWPEGER